MNLEPLGSRAPAKGVPRRERRRSAGAPPPGGDGPPLIRALHQPDAWPHPVRAIEVVQTHISWIVLTGDFAYKIKKPVNLGFLDFSTLARRRLACEEEVRLNRRWSPGLYLGVVPITGTPAHPRIGGSGPAFEYAVCMRQLTRDDELERLARAGRLDRRELEAFATDLARAHAQAPVAAPDQGFGTADAVQGAITAALDGLLERTESPAEIEALARLRVWLRERPGAALLGERLRGGFVREGHGDLHLGNLVRWRGSVHAFDAIEFDPALRWIDVMSDLAFLLMDLAYRGRSDIAYAVLNRYLEVTEDYAGLAVLREYVVYRALVRALVAAIRRRTGDARVRDAASVQRHLALAEAVTEPPRPLLVLMHGYSGSGKTRLSDELLATLPAIRVRSDVERKRGGAPDYGPAAVAATYARLETLAGNVLAAGENVIVDATFLARAERERFYALARRLQVPCVLVGCRAPRGVLEQRLAARMTTGDASDADLAVLSAQMRSSEPLSLAERGNAVEFDTSAPPDPAVVRREILVCARRYPEASPGSGSGPAQLQQQRVVGQQRQGRTQQPKPDQEERGEPS